jgi:hypothetical protein
MHGVYAADNGSIAKVPDFREGSAVRILTSDARRRRLVALFAD